MSLEFLFRSILQLMKAKKKLLILLPVYNDVNRIDRAIMSVVAQEYKDWHLLILDNCSNDGTYEACRKYEFHENVSLKRNDSVLPLNQNWVQAYKIGDKDNSFEYICYLASDDYWEDSKYLTNFMNNFDSSNEIEFLTSKHSCFSDKSEITQTEIHPISLEKSSLKRRMNLLRKWSYVHAIYGIYSKKLFEKLMTDKFSKLTDFAASDWYWTYNLLRYSKINLVSDSTYKYCTDRREPAISLSSSRNLLSILSFPYTHVFSQIKRFSFRYSLDLVLLTFWSIHKVVQNIFRSNRIQRTLHTVRTILTKYITVPKVSNR